MIIPSQDVPISLPAQVVTQREVNADVVELIYWLQQEMLSPELLPYYDVSRIQEALKAQQESIQQLKKNLSKENRQKETQYLTLHVIEWERVQYIYQQYLRIRLQKLMTHGFYYYNNMGELQLCLKEKEFLKNMVEKQVDYLFTNCLQYFQKSQRNFGVRLENQNESQTQDNKIVVSKPETNQYVLIYVNTQRTIHIGSVALSERDCALVCYDDVKIMVPLKSVTLI